MKKFKVHNIFFGTYLMSYHITPIERFLKGTLSVVLGGQYFLKCTICKEEIYSSNVGNHLCKGGMLVQKVGKCAECDEPVFDNGMTCDCKGGSIDINSSFTFKSFEEIKQERIAAEAKKKEEAATESPTKEQTKKSRFRVKPGQDFIQALCDKEHDCKTVFMTATGSCKFGSILRYELGECTSCHFSWFEDQVQCVKEGCEGKLSLNTDVFEIIK
jgi:hypothetical protein